MIERLRTIVEALATPAGRAVGSAGHSAAREYLLDELRRAELVGYGPKEAESFEQPFQRDGTRFTNLIGVLPGTDPELPPVLLAAHYDTCGPYPGADDNAAAIAILLGMLPRLREARLERSIVFAFFDSEEPPHFQTPSMGSTYFYQHQRQSEIHAALVLDLVGHDVPIPGLSNALFITGMESDADFQAIVGTACDPALPTIPVLTRYIGDLSDYRAFRLDERPYLFFSCGHWEHYHMPTDTPEKLNYDKMALIADYLCGVTRKTARAPLEGPFEGYDSTPTEIELFTSAAGPILDALGLRLESRRDLDQLVRELRSRFGI